MTKSAKGHNNVPIPYKDLNKGADCTTHLRNILIKLIETGIMSVLLDGRHCQNAIQPLDKDGKLS